MTPPDWVTSPTAPAGCRFGERGVEPHRGIGVGDAEAVRSDHPHVVAADRVEQARGQCRVAGQAGADHQQCAHPPAPALLGHRGHRRRGHAEHRQVGRLRQLVHRPVAGHAAHLRRVRVHRGEATGEPGPDEVGQHGVAHRVRSAARADDDHRARGEDRDQAGDVRPLLAGGERVEIPVGGVEVELDMHLPVLGPPPCRQAEVGQHLPDALVLPQHVRDEPAHTAAAGPGRQVLQQKRAHAVRLRGVRHRQRDLRGRRVVAAW